MHSPINSKLTYFDLLLLFILFYFYFYQFLSIFVPLCIHHPDLNLQVRTSIVYDVLNCFLLKLFTVQKLNVVFVTVLLCFYFIVDQIWFLRHLHKRNQFQHLYCAVDQVCCLFSLFFSIKRLVYYLIVDLHRLNSKQTLF